MGGWLSGWLGERMAGPVGERLSVGVDVLLLMYRAEGRSSRNSFLQWVQNQIVKRVIMRTSELLEDEKHRQRDGTRRVLSCCLCCESESTRLGLHERTDAKTKNAQRAIASYRRRLPGMKQAKRRLLI